MRLWPEPLRLGTLEGRPVASCSAGTQGRRGLWGVHRSAQASKPEPGLLVERRVDFCNPGHPWKSRAGSPITLGLIRKQETHLS